jgi:segregation and condensation protein B
MTDQNPIIALKELEACIEAILFSAGSPISLVQLATVLDKQEDEIEKALHTLEDHYRLNNHGLSVQWYAGRVQLTTSPNMASAVESFLGYETTSHLSQAALETLAIVAYRQPITRPGVDSIRGVNSDAVLKNLLNKGLIQEIGRSEGPGRPILYAITSEFLQHFGLSSLSELPPYELSTEDITIQQNNGLLKD